MFAVITKKIPTHSQVFTRKSQLKEHIQQVHVGDRPFVCPQCDKVSIEIDVNRLHCELYHSTN